MTENYITFNNVDFQTTFTAVDFKDIASFLSNVKFNVNYDDRGNYSSRVAMATIHLLTLTLSKQ